MGTRGGFQGLCRTACALNSRTAFTTAMRGLAGDDHARLRRLAVPHGVLDADKNYFDGGKAYKGFAGGNRPRRSGRPAGTTIRRAPCSKRRSDTRALAATYPFAGRGRAL
jgi:hypothetical protein